MIAHSSGMSLLLFEALKVGIFWASWHFHELWHFAFCSFLKDKMVMGKKSFFDGFEGFLWFLNVIEGREKGCKQEEEEEKRGEKMEIR